MILNLLLRKICPDCSGAGTDAAELPCALCHGDGFYGRVAVREVISISSEAREAIRSVASPTEIFEIAAREGIKTMAAYSADLVRDGITTEAEVKENVS